MHPNIIEYIKSLEVRGDFYELLGALYRAADSDNVEKIEREWPDFCQTFYRRYHAPGGALDEKEMNWVRSHYGIEEV